MSHRRHDVAGRVLDLDRIDACIFDLDGVLTDTASLHQRAWTEVFDRLFDDRTVVGDGVPPFTEDDYRSLVDGESREDGVRNVLHDRRIDLPEGDPDDPQEARTVHGIAADKDARYLALLHHDGVRPFPSSARMLERLQREGVEIGVVSASRHCRQVLDATGLSSLVDVRVDGEVARAMALPGKPDPALFVEATRRLGSEPGRAAVFEDAQAGVEAGRRGGFAVVIGVDRRQEGSALREHGADIVVEDLGDLSLVGSGPAARDTRLRFRDPRSSEEGVVETLCTLANGYIGTRGARPWASDDGVSYPGAYVAGLYNRLWSEVSGREVEFESLVNVPNWLASDLRCDEGPWLSEKKHEIVEHRVDLDLAGGMLVRSCLVADAEGRRTRLVERRVVSMASPHLMGLELTVLPVDWSGRLELVAGIDANVDVDETLEERLLSHRHLELVDQSSAESGEVWVRVRTVQSHVVVAVAARCRLTPRGVRHEWGDASRPGYPAAGFSLPVEEGQRLSLHKLVALTTSKDRAISEPLLGARALVDGVSEFDDLVPGHRRIWGQLWEKARTTLTDGSQSGEAMTFHLFHLMQVASPHIEELDTGLGARGLHGEGYLGHVFWDTLFLFPVLNYRFPSAARAALAYRRRRLPEARRAAAAAGYRGAMFPWQSGSDGRDETPPFLFNHLSGRWMPDRSGHQRHVGLAIAYEAWQHWQVSGDLEFISGPGLELMVEVARFFASFAGSADDRDRFHIEGVMGPDEFHDGYPWSEEPGVRDNAYTNVMAAWLLWRAQELVALLEGEGLTETLESLEVEPAELAHWDVVSHRLEIPFHDGVISQFAGYEALEPLDLDEYRQRYGDIGRLDLILEAQGDSVDRYQVAKQPDVLMLFYLLSAEELRSVLARMGYGLEADTIRRTVDYYAARVTHGSTLSRVVHSWVQSRADRQASWRYFLAASAVDMIDTRGGSTREGIHLGAMGGAVDLLQRCYTGLEARGETLWLNPAMPPEVRSLSMGLTFRSRPLSLDLTQDRLCIGIQRERAQPLTVMVREEPLIVYPGRSAEVSLG